MHNWKWVNLSKMAGFNICLSLNERQSSSDKKHNKSLRLSAVVSPALYRFLYRQWNKRNYSTPFPKCFSLYLARKTLWVKLFSLNVCEAALQAAIKGGNFGAKLTHLCDFWLDVSFFSRVKKHRSRFWLDVSVFSRVKTIVRSSDWLELSCVRKINDIAFWRVFLSIYIINHSMNSNLTDILPDKMQVHCTYKTEEWSSQ